MTDEVMREYTVEAPAVPGTNSAEAEMLEELARELGVEPADDPSRAVIGLSGLDGHVYSWLELLYAHVRLLKSVNK